MNAEELILYYADRVSDAAAVILIGILIYAVIKVIRNGKVKP